ncbi:MAG: 50S ribosomal protein L25/general stress protein Ctc [Gammaproteobacteria bacterium]|nr:50S ribosomal protein L25/general stress protein Ctc [Gammaproteobacteria bacterium]MDH5801994.1 50S ribosomal protein L25/general stress protein Ctc [Gammaproteobacteria bacterium]
MSISFTVEAEVRTDVGKGASRRLRHANKVPGVMYGAGQDAVSILMNHNEMLHHLEHEAFYSHILTMKVGGNSEKVVLKDVQRDPSKPKILHMDFQRVSETDKIHMHVPLHFVGEANSPGVKAGGSVSHSMTSLDVLCMAKDLPEFIEVDLSTLETGQALHLSDIKLPSGVTIPALSHGADHDTAVVSCHAPKGGAAEEAAAE